MNSIFNLANPVAAASTTPTLTTRSGSGWFSRIKAAIWRAMEDAGRARARRELWSLAERYSATQPELAKDLRSAAGRDPAA